MLKQAFRSYLSSLHPRNIKKIKNNGSWFWPIYFLVIYPALMSASNPNFAKYMWFTMIKLSPFFLMWWSNISSKFLMPKTMFLCPMKQEDRKEYINYVLLLKIGFPVLFGIVIELVWSIFYGFHPWQILAIAFIHFSFGVSTYICFEASGKNDQPISYARKDKNGQIRWAWMNLVNTVLAMLLLMGFELSDMTSVMSFPGAVVIGCWLGALLIFDVLIVVKQYKGTVESACDYELTFRVLSKVPTNTDVEFDMFKK